MASEWELVMGMRYGATISPPPVPAAAASQVNSSPAYLYGLPSTDTLRIDDLLNLNHDVFSSSHAAAADSHNHSSQALLIPKQENSPTFASESNVSSFADDIYIPTEEAAELEWLSKFVEDSFTDVPYPNYLPAATNNQIRVDPANGAASNRGVRSKRFRSTPAVSRMKLAPTSSSSTSSSSSSDFPTPPAHVSGQSRKKAAPVAEPEGGVRRCTHCASEKTPQWRTGPLGPKTLCNACGVRYKSGRLVPEYRPAASPTFVLTQHSNSHRKVMELRRQKEQITNNAAIYH